MSSSKTLTRRELLKMLGAGAAGLAGLQVIAACAPKPAEPAKPTEVQVAEPTAVPKATAAPAQPVEIRITCYDIGEAWNKNAEDVVAGFAEEQPNIKAKFEWRPGQGFWDKLQTEFVAATAPDVTIINMDWLIPAASRGMFLSLNPYIERDNVDMSAYWYNHDLEWKWKGQLYGGLLYAGGQAMYANVDLLKEAELDLPKEDWTWDDMLAYAKKTTNASKNQWGLTINPIDVPYWSSSFIHAAGGTVLNDTYDKCTLTSPEARGALQWLADLMHKEKVMPTPSVFQGQDDPFVTGKVALCIGGTWLEASLRAAKLNWEWIRMPVHPKTGKRSVQMGSNAWGIIANGKHLDESWLLVKYLMGEKGQRGFMKLGVPGLKSVVESQEYKDLHKPQNILTPIADFSCCPHNYYPTPDTSEWWSALSNEMAVVWSGEATVDEATARTCKALDDIFAKRPAEWK